MARETVMVREDTDKAAFHPDEQQLGREGWSVHSTVNTFQQMGVVHRIRSLFTRKPAHCVVTYRRPQGMACERSRAA
jgi:hypothetical protein